MQLTVKDVSFCYDVGTPDCREALQNVSFTVNNGDFFGISGHTGSGKSTLIRMFNGLLKPSSGTILLDGTDITSKELSPIELRSKVGLVFQYPEHQLFEKTVLDDVMFGPLNIGLSPDAARSAAQKALLSLGLSEEFYNRKPTELSGGEKRRVAIAGLLAMDPSVIVLDEPAAGLDPAAHAKLFEVLQKLNREGKTIIMVSHDTADVSRYCNRALLLEDGKVKACGDVKEVPLLDEQIHSLIEALEQQEIFLSSEVHNEEDLLAGLKALLKRR